MGSESLSVLKLTGQCERHQTVQQGHRSSHRIHYILNSGERLLRHTVKSSESNCSSKALSAHMGYKAFFTTTVHSGRSKLGAHHQTPPSCMPFPLRHATPALSTPELQPSCGLIHHKVQGTHNKSKGPGEGILPQHGYRSAQPRDPHYNVS